MEKDNNNQITLPNQTAYEFLEERTKNIGANIAKNMYGKKITYDEFRENIASAAKGFDGMGISYRNRVGIIMPNVPETAYMQYGLNKIGAVADYIDPRTKPAVLKEFIDKEKIEMIVCAKECYDSTILPVENEIMEMLKVKDIVIPSSIRSLPSGIKQLVALKSFLTSKHEDKSVTSKISYDTFLKQSKKLPGYTISGDASNLAIITHSSGTTGIPKPIPLTNENMNSLVIQHDMIDLGIKPGMTMLHILPYFAAYGSVNSEHLGTCMGMEMLEVPVFDLAKFPELILKLKPNIIIGIPSWFELLIKSPATQNADLSFLKIAVAGGDSLDPKTEQKINNFLIEHNAQCVLTKGHGMSEIAGCGTYTTNDCNHIGDVGKELPLTHYYVVDPITKKEIIFDGSKDITGEAYITGPALTPGNLDGREIVSTTMLNNQRCIISGDLITKRKNGSIHFEERLDRGFTRFDGYKIHPAKIEECILKHSAIKDCMIVNYYDDKHFGNMPIVHVVLEDNIELASKEEIIKEIIFEIIQEDKNMTTRDIPTKWKFRTNIPLTLMSKKDYMALKNEELDGSELNVIIDEDNMKLQNITIESEKNPLLIKK